MTLNQQRRWRTAYRFYEDQLRTTLPKARSREPTFIVAENGTKVKKMEPSFSKAFYQTDTIGQAVQFMNAGNIPKPPEDDDISSYDEYMTAAFQAAKSGSDDTRADSMNERSSSRPPKEMTDEQLRAAAKQVEQNAKAMGRMTLDYSTMSNEADREGIVKKQAALEHSKLPLDDSVDIPTQRALEKERKRLNANPEPRMSDFTGTEESRTQQFEHAVRNWEKQDKLGSSHHTDYFKRHSQRGAPMLTSWGKDDEAAHATARSAFMNHYLSKPGWTPGNFAAMYSTMKTGKPTGIVSVGDIKGPAWQL